MTFLPAVLLAGLGVAAAVYGERDDSPGMFLIGLLLAAGAGVTAWRRARPSR